MRGIDYARDLDAEAQREGSQPVSINPADTKRGGNGVVWALYEGDALYWARHEELHGIVELIQSTVRRAQH